MTNDTSPFVAQAPQKLAPNSQDSEEAVLGAVLINPDVLPDLLAFLRGDDFYFMHHRFVWEALLALHERGDAIDVVTAVEELRYMRDCDGQTYLDKIGGSAFLTYLINNTPTHVHVDTYGRIVERLAVRRRLLDAASNIAKAALTDDIELEEVIERSEKSLLTVTRRDERSGFVPMATSVREYLDRMEELAANRDAGIGLPTGFTDLDRLTGGLNRKDLILVAARPGVGKTSFMLSVMMNAARALRPSPVNVALLTMEMSREQILQRLFSMETGINGQVFKMGALDEPQWGRFIEATGRLDNLRIFINDTPTLTPRQLLTQCKALKDEYGLDLLIVDYLQLMNGDTKTDNRTQEVSQIARGLKRIAMELNMPVMAAAQLSRKLEERSDKRPMLSDLRESGGQEQDADIVEFIYRDELYNPNTSLVSQAEIIVAKHRNGPTGVVNLFFQKELTLFKNIRRNSVDLKAFANPDHD